MRNVVILALLAALSLPAFAAAEGGGHGAAAEGGHGAKKEGEAKKGKPGTNVEMPYLMAPLTNAAGKLTGYAYISTRLTAMSEANALAVRDKLAFIQDAMVRDVNAASVTTLDDPEKVDIAATERRLLADATKVMGAGRVRLITVCTVHVAELRPAQTPARDVPQEDMIPHGTTPKNPIKSRCED